MLDKSQTKATIRKYHGKPYVKPRKILSCTNKKKKKPNKSIKNVTLSFGNDGSDGRRASGLWKRRCLPWQRL